MQVTKEGIERIKAASDLAEVVAERGIRLQKKGRQLVAPCPFHEEKTASFNVSSSKGLFHCFGCGASGDVIGFVTKYDKVSFSAALETLARRAGLDLAKLMEERPRIRQKTPLPVLTRAPEIGHTTTSPKAPAEGALLHGAPQQPSAVALLPRVIDHYHRTFCEREDAQAYLRRRGITDADLWKAHRIGYADGSLLKTIPKTGEVRDELLALGIITSEGRELLGGCIVVPIPDPASGQWTSLYGRGMKTARHCYLPGPLRGVLNFQAARTSEEVVLTESIFDALSFHQVGVSVAIPIYGTNGFTSDHLDLLKREQVRRVVLALDSDPAGRKATDALKGKLEAAGIVVRVASFPAGTKDANELLVSRNGDASQALRAVLDEAEPRQRGLGSPTTAAPLAPEQDESIRLSRDGITYQARVHSLLLGRLRATVKATKGDVFHVDTIDLYASRSRAEFAKRASRVLAVSNEAVEAALLSLLVEAEKTAEAQQHDAASPAVVVSESERAEALSFLRRRDLLDQVAKDLDSLGFVGEDTNKRLLYLVAVSR
ncbi:MAG TPA: toprim domain-containing protein, partial [Alphaproteobacteria bacterium]|nr:toprim domain-containing protein [Alphaproteobacteria bacterium]